MIIAPGELIDRQWSFVGIDFSIKFVRYQPVLVRWLDESETTIPLGDDIGTATLRRYRHPAWRILLPFFVDSRIGDHLPYGYVMPGWIHGVPLESHPLTYWKRNRREHLWELRDMAGELAGVVTDEIIHRLPELEVQDMTAQFRWPPLPDEAFRPKDTGPQWMPLSPERLMEILDGES